MKAFALTWLVFAITVMSGGVAGALPVITNGLVAAYEFSSNANDVSGNGNHGVVNGATLTADRFGNLDSAYSFDASRARIEVAPIFSSDQTQLTYVSWVKINASFGGTIYGEYSTSGWTRNYFLSGPYQGGYVTLSTYPSSGQLNREVFFQRPDLVSDWVQVALVREGNTVHGYLNGSYYGSDTASGTYSGPTPTLAAIGNRYNSVAGGWYVNGDTYKWDGAIDELLVYDRALSATEVQTLYSPVPEPTTALLVGLGLLGLGIRRSARSFTPRGASTDRCGLPSC